MQICLFHSLKILRWSPLFVGQSSDSFAGRARGCVIWPLLSSPVPSGSLPSPSVLTNAAARSPSRSVVQGRCRAHPPHSYLGRRGQLNTLLLGSAPDPCARLGPCHVLPIAPAFSPPQHLPHCEATVIYPSTCPLASEPGTTSESLTAVALVPGTAPATWSALNHDVFSGLIWGQSEPTPGMHSPRGSCALPPWSGWAPSPGQGLCLPQPVSFPGLPELSMVLPVSLASALHEAVKKNPVWDCVQWSWAVPGFGVTSLLCGNREYIPYMSPDGPIVGEGESHIVGVQSKSGGSLTNLL